MFQPINKDEIYFLLNLDNNTHFKIGNKKDLIKHVANMLANDLNYEQWQRLSRWSNKYWYNKEKHTANIEKQKALQENIKNRFEYELFHRWNTNNVFTQQNLTGKDTYQTIQTSYKQVQDDPDDETTIRTIRIDVYVDRLYPYVFYTGTGATFDIRLILNEVKQCLINGDYQYPRTWRRINRQHRKSHTKHNHSRSIHLREQRSKISCEEQGVHYRNKALPYDSASRWDNYAPSRHSTGWKDRKNTKQWMHNLKNKKVAPLSLGRAYFKNDTLIEEREMIDLIEKETLISPQNAADAFRSLLNEMSIDHHASYNVATKMQSTSHDDRSDVFKPSDVAEFFKNACDFIQNQLTQIN